MAATGFQTTDHVPPLPAPVPPEPFVMVIFGATGDLAARKLLPSLFGQWQSGYLPELLRPLSLAAGRRTRPRFERMSAPP